MIITLLIFQLLFKDRLQFKKAYLIIKWIIIGYVIVNLISFIILIIINHEKSAFINRATGKYWFSYWFMIFSSLFLPFFLFYKKIGLKPLFLLFVSITMKIGWYFERYIIFLADYNIRQFDPEKEFDWLTSPWGGFYLIWIQGLILALILVGGITIIERLANKRTLHNKN